MIRLANWSTCFVTGSEGIDPDGRQVVSAAITEKLSPIIIKCSDGETFELVGEPDPKFVAFCESIHKPLNIADPIRLRGDQ